MIVAEKRPSGHPGKLGIGLPSAAVLVSGRVRDLRNGEVHGEPAEPPL